MVNFSGRCCSVDLPRIRTIVKFSAALSWRNVFGSLRQAIFFGPSRSLARKTAEAGQPPFLLLYTNTVRHQRSHLIVPWQHIDTVQTLDNDGSNANNADNVDCTIATGPSRHATTVLAAKAIRATKVPLRSLTGLLTQRPSSKATIRGDAVVDSTAPAASVAAADFSRVLLTVMVTRIAKQIANTSGPALIAAVGNRIAMMPEGGEANLVRLYPRHLALPLYLQHQLGLKQLSRQRLKRILENTISLVSNLAKTRILSRKS